MVSSTTTGDRVEDELGTGRVRGGSGMSRSGVEMRGSGDEFVDKVPIPGNKKRASPGQEADEIRCGTYLIHRKPGHRRRCAPRTGGSPTMAW
jgi:hypothetical protein